MLERETTVGLALIFLVDIACGNGEGSGVRDAVDAGFGADPSRSAGPSVDGVVPPVDAGRDTGPREQPDASPDAVEEMDAQSDADGEQDAGDAGDAETPDTRAAECGDGVQDPGEDCDDGDSDDTDGCTAACEYTCTADNADSKCDDSNPCTLQQCDADHTCLNPGDNSADGDPCTHGDVDGYCKEGICTAPVCGDGDPEPGEQCDRGEQNGSEGSGCTSECSFECDADSDCYIDDNPCGGQFCEVVADGAGKTCAQGAPLSEGDLCRLGPPRWICNAVGDCARSICGDLIVDTGASEECDDGNSDQADGCTNLCRFTCTESDAQSDCDDGDPCTAQQCDEFHVCRNPPDSDANSDACMVDALPGYCYEGVCIPFCGDGVIHADRGEQCDDGNLTNLDVCSALCEVEIVHRLTRMDLLGEAAPDWCTYYNNAHSGNAIGDAFLLGPVMDQINASVRDALDNGDANALLQILGMSDPSAQTADPEIDFGVYIGQPDGDWANTPDKLDFPFRVRSEDVDSDRMPTTVMPAQIAVNGLSEARTTSPTSIVLQFPLGELGFYNTMFRTSVDNPPPPSQIAPPPPTHASVLVPETLGGDGEASPTGTLCGAISTESLAAIPLTTSFTDLCTAPSYVPCGPDQIPGVDCDSLLDLIQGGCWFTIVPLVVATDPDVDHSGDGTNDAYSAVMGISAKRAKITGVAPP